jgi:hypothetical protein
VLSVEDWAEIRRQSEVGEFVDQRDSRQVGVARNSVRSEVRFDEVPAYHREGTGSIVDTVCWTR